MRPFLCRPEEDRASSCSQKRSKKERKRVSSGCCWVCATMACSALFLAVWVSTYVHMRVSECKTWIWRSPAWSFLTLSLPIRTPRAKREKERLGNWASKRPTQKKLDAHRCRRCLGFPPDSKEVHQWMEGKEHFARQKMPNFFPTNPNCDDDDDYELALRLNNSPVIF